MGRSCFRWCWRRPFRSSARVAGPPNVTRLCGWALVLIALIFLAATRTMGGELLFRLSTDITQTQIVDRQAAFRYGPPTSFLGFTLDPTTMMVTNGLQVGWYLTLLAGGLMAGRPVRALRHRREVVIAMVVIGAVLMWGFTSGLLAQDGKVRRPRGRASRALELGGARFQPSSVAQPPASLRQCARDRPRPR